MKLKKNPNKNSDSLFGLRVDIIFADGHIAVTTVERQRADRKKP